MASRARQETQGQLLDLFLLEMPKNNKTRVARPQALFPAKNDLKNTLRALLPGGALLVFCATVNLLNSATHNERLDENHLK